MFEETEGDERSVRIPIVSSYAYELVHQIFPLRGMPCRTHTKALGSSGNVVDSARYQMNRAHLSFYDRNVVAEVRSWEPKPSEPNKTRKTLQALIIVLRVRNHREADRAAAAILEANRQCPNARIDRGHDLYTIEFDRDWLITNGPQIVIER